MNILHLIESLDIGGAQIRLLNDLKFMDIKGFNHIVCSLTANGRFLEAIRSLGIRTYSLNGKRSLISMLRLARILRENHIDIIHTQLFFSDLLGRILGKILQIPAIVTTVQSSVYEPDNKYLYSLRRKLLDRYSGKLCNKRFIAVSNFVKDSISRHLKINPDIIEVIPNYVDFDQLNQVRQEDLDRLKRQLPVTPQDFLLITVGGLYPPKGVQYLLRAMPEVIARRKSIKLLIAGGGPYQSDLEKLAEGLGLGNKVVFLGRRDDVKELLHLSDMFVFPTLSEGMPLSLLEAMASGLPAVASDIGPVREIIVNGQNGVLFRPKDSDDLARALVDIISDTQQAQRLGQAGRIFVQDKFAPQKNARLLEEFYMRLS
jgi:glycosyltransferase involved in cell wall biosynthesis